MRVDLSNIGNPWNLLKPQKMFQDYGPSRVQLICTNSKKSDAMFFIDAQFAQLIVSQSKSTPTCLTLSPDSSSFVTFSLPDRQIRVFSFLSGKLTRKYDESLAAVQEMQQAGTAVYKVEDMEFGRRLAVERELEVPGPDGRIPGRWINAVWDESGAFILYPSLLGIKGEFLPLQLIVGEFNAPGVKRSTQSQIACPDCWGRTKWFAGSTSLCTRARLPIRGSLLRSV